MNLVVGGHALAFSDFQEICQGGPETCSLSIDGLPLEGLRFDPSPLEFEGTLLVPMRKNSFFNSGYVLARIDLETGTVKIVSKIWDYMRLLRIEGRAVKFATTASGQDTAICPIK